MAIDGIMLNLLKRDIEAQALDSRVDKIFQPSKYELIINLRGKKGPLRLILSANANSAGIYFTKTSPDNPKNPPMFCMLLRKHLAAAKLLRIRQLGLDRILMLDFEAVNELGDYVINTLVIEVMGRHSNIILLKPGMRIADSIKRITADISSVRQIQPGLIYRPPPSQYKVNILNEEIDKAVERILGQTDRLLSSAILGSLEGFSPIVSREVSHYTGRGQDKRLSELGEAEMERLSFFLSNLKSKVINNEITPVIIEDTGGRPMDFSYINITQYGLKYKTHYYDSLSEMLDNFYREKDQKERIAQKSSDLLKLLTNSLDRLTRKIEILKKELDQTRDKERLRIFGDLISSNIHQIPDKSGCCEVENFYEEGSPYIRIELDPALSPAANAQRYYKEYKKAATAEKILAEQMEKARLEINYLESVFDSLSRAESLSELEEIRQELAEQGYLRERKQKQKPQTSEFKKFVSGDGFVIVVGRNNIQNDRLTFKTAKKTDLWLHVKNIPGSHTIIQADNRTVTPQAIREAANIAAFHSKARESSNVAVDYTCIRNVKKPPGAKPGMVIYDNYKTIYVTPDRSIINQAKKE